MNVDKGDCRALAEVCTLPSAILDNVMWICLTEIHNDETEMISVKCPTRNQFY